MTDPRYMTAPRPRAQNIRLAKALVGEPLPRWDDLTPEQSERWDWAVEEYSAIIGELLAQIPQEVFMSRGKVYNPAGHRSSRLFRRLLDGKQALTFQPPCSFGEPWHDIFDHPTSWHSVKSVEKDTRRRRPYRHKPALLINDHQWLVVGGNRDAVPILKHGRGASVPESAIPIIRVKSVDAPEAPEAHIVPAWHGLWGRPNDVRLRAAELASRLPLPMIPPEITIRGRSWAEGRALGWALSIEGDPPGSLQALPAAMAEQKKSA